METISIPSPSTFLQSPILQTSTVTATTAVPLLSNSNAKRKAPMAAKPKPIKTKADGVTKPKQSKSRNGCVTCKAKRLKCDETKPGCQQCQKRNVECGGYKKDFKWRSFEETSFSKPVASPTKGRKPSAPFKREHSPAPHSPSPSDASGATLTPMQFPSTPLTAVSSLHNYSPLQSHSRIPSLVHQTSSNSSFNDASSFVLDGGLQPMLQSTYTETTPRSIPTTTNLSSNYDEGGLNTSTTVPSSYSSGQSPRLIDLLLPGTDLSPPPDYMSLRPQQSDIPYQPEGFPLAKAKYQTIDEEEIEEIERDHGPTMDDWLLRPESPTLSSTKSDSPGLEISTFMFNQPVFSSTSLELLMQLFDKATCGILSVRDGPNENPWRTTVWPLARDSPALLHAISSMTAFHSSRHKPEMKVEGIEHMRHSIQHLSDGINTHMRVDAALATTLVLAFAESWDVHVTTGIQHLQGAKILVNQALARTRQNNFSAVETARVKFLCNVWIYMDVIARLTSNNDNLDDKDSALWSQVDPHGTSTEIDPLMGCASTLFPIIGRVANLIRKVRKTSSNTIKIIDQARDLKIELEDWHPPTYFNQPEDPTCEVQHSLQTAEAYRWATLLYLHQAVPEIPSRTAGQLANKVLERLATVPLASRTTIVQIYPLLAAGCEARSQEDRNWVRERWIAMSERMQIGNIERCLDVVKEVWKRRDRYRAVGQIQGQSRGRFQSGHTSSVANSAFTLSPSHVRKSSFSFDLDELVGGWDNMTSLPRSSKRRVVISEHGMPSAVRLGPQASTLEEQRYWGQGSHMIQNAGSQVRNVQPMMSPMQTDLASLDDDAGVLVDWPDGLEEEQMHRLVDAQGRARAGLQARKGSLEARHELDRERTVRGNQHWVGVMKDWKWEVLLG